MSRVAAEPEDEPLAIERMLDDGAPGWPPPPVAKIALDTATAPE